LCFQSKALSSGELSKIEFALDELILPYKIDLCHFDLIDNPALVDHILRYGEQFYP
jgi:uncharacterized protein